MFAKLFGRFKRPAPQAAQAARVPDGRRVYAIGDIHGRVDLLEELHSLILRDVMIFQGAARSSLVQAADGLKNVSFMPLQPLAQLNELLKSCRYSSIAPAR